MRVRDRDSSCLISVRVRVKERERETSFVSEGIDTDSGVLGVKPHKSRSDTGKGRFLENDANVAYWCILKL